MLIACSWYPKLIPHCIHIDVHRDVGQNLVTSTGEDEGNMSDMDCQYDRELLNTDASFSRAGA